LTPLLSALVLSVALRGCIAGFVTGFFTRLVFGTCAPTVGALLVWPLVLLPLTGLTLSWLGLTWFFLALLWIALLLVLFALAGLLVRLLALFTHRVSPLDAHQRVSMPLDAEAIRMPAPRGGFNRSMQHTKPRRGGGSVAREAATADLLL
jgi:hypothetical protein